MGYDLHITRRADWSTEGDDITSDEWLRLVASDPDLRLAKENGPFFAIWSGPVKDHAWLDWSDGQIRAKNPDDALISKMVEIARKLGATVQGDDGEVYRDARDAHRHPANRPVSFLPHIQRAARWLKDRLIRPKLVVPPFRVGDRVMDASSRLATVRALDRKEGYGHGTVRIRYDDGTEAKLFLFANGLSLQTDQGDVSRKGQRKREDPVGPA